MCKVHSDGLKIVQVQERFDVDIQVMPDQVEPEKYINST